MFEEENKSLERLNARLEKLSGAKDKGSSRASYGGSSLDLGLRIVADLVAGIVVGAGIGVLLDKIFATRGIYLIVFLILGGFASFLNVYKTAQNYEKMQEKREKEEGRS